MAGCLKIRYVQLQELRAPGVVETVGDALRRSLPEPSGALDDEALRSFVERGIERAGRLGFSETSQVLRYVGAALLLGEGFEDDPALPWARLALQCVDAPEARLARLFEAMRRQARASAGPAGGPDV